MQLRLHGANPEKLYKQFGIKMPSKVIDFSTNTNVLDFDIDWNLDIKNLIQEYPDDECVLLCDLLAKNNNVSKDNILISNGSNELIYIICSYLVGKKVAILSPSYSEYTKALEAYGIEYDQVSNIAELEKYDACFICNPNNPTGTYVENDVIEKLLSKDVLVILDEAYRDFLLEEKAPINVAQYENLLILRSLTKTYHLSGIRVGYLIASASNVVKMKKRQPTWSVNSIAQVLAQRYLENENYIVQIKQFYKSETPRVIESLRKIGMDIKPTMANFYLLSVKDDIALIKKLLEYGIVVRHTRNFKGLDGEFVRISVKSQPDNDYLISILKELSYENIYF